MDDGLLFLGLDFSNWFNIILTGIFSIAGAYFTANYRSKILIPTRLATLNRMQLTLFKLKREFKNDIDKLVNRPVSAGHGQTKVLSRSYWYKGSEMLFAYILIEILIDAAKVDKKIYESVKNVRDLSITKLSDVKVLDIKETESHEGYAKVLESMETLSEDVKKRIEHYERKMK